MHVSSNTWLQRLPAKLSKLAMLMVFTSLLAGCGSKEPPASVTGKILFRGKPVYPAVILLQSDSGQGLTDSVDDQGNFRVFGVKSGKSYAVAVEPIKLAGLSKAGSIRGNTEETPEKPANREETVPDEFKAANIDIPKKYAKFETSGLVIDCRNGIPEAAIELKLD